jgi:hypothetical protein
MALVAGRHLTLERDNLFRSERSARKPDRNREHSAAYQNAQRRDLDWIRWRCRRPHDIGTRVFGFAAEFVRLGGDAK